MSPAPTSSDEWLAALRTVTGVPALRKAAVSAAGSRPFWIVVAVPSAEVDAVLTRAAASSALLGVAEVLRGTANMTSSIAPTAVPEGGGSAAGDDGPSSAYVIVGVCLALALALVTASVAGYCAMRQPRGRKDGVPAEALDAELLVVPAQPDVVVTNDRTAEL